MTVRADAELVRATLLNLLLNAGQAIGRPWACGRSRVAERRPGVGGRPGRRSWCRYLARVLEPFFTTESRGGGLGLAIAKRTAEIRGGTLTLDCPPGGGTMVDADAARRSDLGERTAGGRPHVVRPAEAEELVVQLVEDVEAGGLIDIPEAARLRERETQARHLHVLAMSAVLAVRGRRLREARW